MVNESPFDRSPTPLAPSFQDIRAKDYVAPGTSSALLLALFMAMCIVLVTILVTWGIAILVSPILWLVDYYRNRHLQRIIRGSSIRVSSKQFPTIFNTVEQQSKRLGLTSTPAVYIIEDNTQNAFALSHRKEKIVLLTDDIVYGALNTENQAVLDFIVGHELAHIALGHDTMIRSWMRKLNRSLSRLDEFSCDAVGQALVGNNKACCDAIALLTVGPYLLPSIDQDALIRQAEDVIGDKGSRKAEKYMTHPLLMRRYAKLLGKEIKL